MKPNSSSIPFASMTGARQTMLSWARVMETYAEVPDVFKQACKTRLESVRPFPYVVFAPAIQGTGVNATEKLLCEIDEVLLIWERIGDQVVLHAYPIKAIDALEIGRILLNSWFTVSGITTDGSLSSTVIPFNTATMRHLEPFIDRMLPMPAEIREADWQTELAKLDTLSQISFKFMNFGRESLTRGESIRQILWQPQIRQPIFSLLGRWIQRTMSLAHLALLTDRQVILVRDDEHSHATKGNRYGGIWQYIPLHKIADATISEALNELVTLSISFVSGGQPVDAVFAAANKPALENFRQELLDSLKLPA